MSCPELRRDLAPRRPQDPAGSVPRDRASDPSGGDDGEPSRAGRDKQYHPLSVDRPARIERPSHVVGAHGPSGGEADAALAAAARQDRAPSPGPHPDPEPVRLRAVTPVRLVRALTLGHPREFPSEREGRRRRPDRRVYGAASSQDKGLDNRKSVKTSTRGLGVEKAGAIIRPASPPGEPGPRRRGATDPFPRGFSTVVERCCG